MYTYIDILKTDTVIYISAYVDTSLCHLRVKFSQYRPFMSPPRGSHNGPLVTFDAASWNVSFSVSQGCNQVRAPCHKCAGNMPH